ncbi:MAG: ACP S-malonyltransferase [Acidimicrobiales bacterium]
MGGHDWNALDFDDVRVSMPCTFVASYLNASGGLHPTQCRHVLGHSLGEITALTFAGAMSEDDAFELVVRRGALCHEAQSQRPGGMLAVIGLSGDQIEWVRRSAVGRTSGVLEVAAVNTSRQMVLTGDNDALDVALATAVGLGAAAARLPIGGGFHSPLMAGVADEFARAVDRITWAQPQTSLISSVDSCVHTDPADLARLLVWALVLPVRWSDAMRTLSGLGATAVWEAGPGTTLARLARHERWPQFVAGPRDLRRAATVPI